jgi:NAD(P)-dependent dehydrogenase (short-subunit alcohol dehydrogenase family)
MVDTHIYDDGTISIEQLEEDKKRYPLKRYGKPEEVAYVVIYLLSDAAAWTTGSSIVIDGGYTLN